MFTVKLQPSGHSFEIAPGARILSSALKAGHYIRYSCRQGMCGMCTGEVLAGCVDHGVNPPPLAADPDGGAGPAFLCQATARTDLVIGVEELEMVTGPRRMPCRVAKLEKLAADVALLRVRVPPNDRLDFLPGQYVEFELGGVRRNYSVANAHEEGGCLLLDFHVRHRPTGQFTDRVFGGMKERDLLALEGPLGGFFLQTTDRPILLCATGTGFAPIKSILETIFRDGRHLRQPVHFYWGGRTADDLYLSGLLDEWTHTYPGFHFHPVLSRDPAGRPEARRGYVQAAVLADFADLSGHQVYACGSGAMIAAAKAAFVGQRGLPASEFHADEFLPASAEAAPIPALN